jgi:hypothetical protein
VRIASLAWSALGALLAPVASAAACPLCRTETGEAVRAAVVADLGTGLLATLAPFGVLLAVVALVRRDPRGRRPVA